MLLAYTVGDYSHKYWGGLYRRYRAPRALWLIGRPYMYI